MVRAKALGPPLPPIWQLLVGLLISLSPLQAAQWVVSSVEDEGPGSFRNAIDGANASPGRDQIIFRLDGPAPHTIALRSPLPVITEAVTIDALAQGTGIRPVELDGFEAGENAAGIEIAARDCLVRGLCINNFSGHAIFIGEGSSNTVQGNFIGTDPAGQAIRPNGGAGIFISDSAANLIGGTNIEDMNLLSGNVTGLLLLGVGSSSNRVQGNFIGTDILGANAIANNQNGILIFDAPKNIIGGFVPGARNVIAANEQSGIYITGEASRSNLVVGNFIGADVSGRQPLGNKVDGVTIFGAADNQIGSTNVAGRNLIAGNLERGVLITDLGATNNLVVGNFIGIDMTGTNLLGNEFSGVGIVEAAANRVGADTPGARNIISGNGQSGVAIEGGSSSNNIVQGNFLGTDPTGSLAISNRFNGVTIIDSPNNLIGGDTAGAANVISGNAEHGVWITEPLAVENRVYGNFIGCDSTGVFAIGNAFAGIQLQAPANQIGRPGGRPNIISGNHQTGLYISGRNAVSNRIQGNFIGTDLAGTNSIANLVSGIGIVGGVSNLIGGEIADAGNLISGNFESGIFILAPDSTGNMVKGNTIGSDLAGNLFIPNTGDGVGIYRSAGNIIGGENPLAANVISGNGFSGVFITGIEAESNVVQRNWIGTHRDGTTAIGNRLHGIEIDENASRNIIGGSLQRANRIAFSRTAAVGAIRVANGSANLIRYNSIYSNAGYAIDLGPEGVTQNDAQDADAGPNDLQNFPVLNSVTGGLSTVVRGTLESAPQQNFIIDFYVNAIADPSGYGEAETWLGTSTVRTDAGGSASFSLFFPAQTPGGRFVSATATDANGNTSEMSLSRMVESGDADEDGMSDDFEIAHQLDPLAASDASADPDGDGLSNLEEFLVGTLPKDKQSVFKLDVSARSRFEASLRFNSVLNSKYRLEYSGSPAGPWLPLRDLTGTGSPIETRDTLRQGEERFYRLVFLS